MYYTQTDTISKLTVATLIAAVVSVGIFFTTPKAHAAEIDSATYVSLKAQLTELQKLVDAVVATPVTIDYFMLGNWTPFAVTPALKGVHFKTNAPSCEITKEGSPVATIAQNGNGDGIKDDNMLIGNITQVIDKTTYYTLTCGSVTKDLSIVVKDGMVTPSMGKGAYATAVATTRQPTEKEYKAISELQKQIDNIVNNKNNSVTDEKPVKIKQATSSVKAKLFTVSKGKSTSVKSGQEHVELVEVKVLPQKEDTYLNTITIEASSVKQKVWPWETFSQITVWSQGKKIGATDLDTEKVWTPKKVGDDIHVWTAKVFNGNYKIAAKEKPEFNVTASIATKAPKDQKKWNITIPQNGVTVWTKTNGHQNYGLGKNIAHIQVK